MHFHHSTFSEDCLCHITHVNECTPSHWCYTHFQIALVWVELISLPIFLTFWLWESNCYTSLWEGCSSLSFSKILPYLACSTIQEDFCGSGNVTTLKGPSCKESRWWETSSNSKVVTCFQGLELLWNKLEKFSVWDSPVSLYFLLSLLIFFLVTKLVLLS